MWATALRQLGKDLDPVGAPPISSRWMAMVHALTPTRAFGVGALLVAASSRAWLFTLAAIGVIGQAAHERPIMIAVSLILGSFFLWAGIRGLAG